MTEPLLTIAQRFLPRRPARDQDPASAAHPAAHLRAHAPAIYYALLFAPARVQSTAWALYAWAHAIAEVHAPAGNAAVAQVQFAWWRQELASTAAGAPHHPYMQALAPAFATGDLALTALVDIVNAYERHLLAGQPTTYTALAAHGIATEGGLARLTAKLCGGDPVRVRASAEHFGLGLALTGLVQHCGGSIRRGQLSFAADDCARHGVNTAMRRAAAPVPPPVRALIAQYSERARAAFSAALKEIPAAGDSRCALRVHIVRAELAQLLLAEIARSDFAVLSQCIEVPALRQLWRAWRVARAESRRRLSHRSP